MQASNATTAKAQVDFDDDSGNEKLKMAASVVNQEDSFFFKQNKVLERDIRARLGDKKAIEIARASRKGFDQARCISEL